jgi:endonuclease YncB( thermonuclease family)
MSTMNTYPRTRTYFRFVLFLFITYLPCLSYADTFIAKVVGVSDGDTVTVVLDKPCNSQKNCKGGKVQYRIRLAEIDTPEKNQPYGAKAKQNLSDLVFGRIVKVARTDTDQYGRLVANLYVDGKWVNAELIRSGSAWVYRKYARTASLFELEKEAKSLRLGLWSLPEAERTPPWQWRRKK